MSTDEMMIAMEKISREEREEEHWTAIREHLAAILERPAVETICIAAADEVDFKPFRTVFRVSTSIRGHHNSERFGSIDAAKESYLDVLGMRGLDAPPRVEIRLEEPWRTLDLP